MSRHRVLSAALLSAGLLGALAAAQPQPAPLQPAQPAQPPAPANFQVTIRYRIIAPRDQHVKLYDDLIELLKKVNFDFEPPLDQHEDTDREDPSKNYLHGKIAAADAYKILQSPSVAGLLLVPEGFKLPDDLDQPVRVRLELAGGLGLERQRELAEQVRAILDHLKFREAVGYHHHGHVGRPFTRLVGTVPAGRLNILLKDLRGQPAGWFASRVPPQEVPEPLRSLNPLRVIEVLPDPDLITDVGLPGERTPDYLEKIDAPLWALVQDKDSQDGEVRIELVFNGSPPQDLAAWRGLLSEKAPGVFVEGQLGHVVTCLAYVHQVKLLASLTEVSAVRMPTMARVHVSTVPPIALDADKALDLSGLATLHKKGHRGQGVRLAIIDTDFRLWQDMVRAGKLPKSTRLVDLTAERYYDLLPAEEEGDPKQPGHGTQCALAAALAAPDVQLVLIRIDASAPYQMEELVRYFRGDTMLSPHLDRRRDDLAADRSRLDDLRDLVLLERRLALEDFIDERDQELDFGFLGPIYGWVFSTRTWSRDRVAYTEKLDRELKDRIRRYFSLTEAVRGLKGVKLMACSVLWNDGYALGGSSPLSRSFDRGLKNPPLWFQSAGNARGQTWSGPFRDDDLNGAMEFAAPGVPLKKGRWTSELNFLGWQPWDGIESAELPADTPVRISVQWREPHDPDYFAKSAEEDFYRKPLADVRLALLRQRDPEAKTVPADAFEVAARSGGQPQRLEHLPSGSVYEVVLETKVAKAGHFAVRVERPVGFQWFLDESGKGRPVFSQVQGLQPSGLRPLGAVTLPALQKNWDLQVRLFVETPGPLKLKGRPVFADLSTDMGSVGMPADARSVITVGACDFEGGMRSYSGGGPVAFAELSRKPALLAFDGLPVAPKGQASAFGASLAAPFAAGTAACLLSAGFEHQALFQQLRDLNGKVLRVSAK